MIILKYCQTLLQIVRLIKMKFILDRVWLSVLDSCNYETGLRRVQIWKGGQGFSAELTRKSWKFFSAWKAASFIYSPCWEPCAAGWTVGALDEQKCGFYRRTFERTIKVWVSFYWGCFCVRVGKQRHDSKYICVEACCIIQCNEISRFSWHLYALKWNVITTVAWNWNPRKHHN